MVNAEQEALSQEATRMANKIGPEYTASPGKCAQVMRIVCTKVLGIKRAWEPGPDAGDVGRLLAARGCEVTDGSGPQVGDLIVWDTPEHGQHGHIAMRVVGNRIAENATIHFNETGDARGFRPLAHIPGHYKVFRLWR